MVDLGNILNMLDPVVVITQLQPISVIFNVPQDQNPLIQRRMAENPNLPVEAFDRDGKHLLAMGQIWGADNLIDTSTGTLRIKAVFENKDFQLYPNQFVNVRLLLDVLSGQTFVQRSAIQQDPSGYHVFIVKEDQTVTVRPIEVGPSEGDFTIVKSGLASGEVVVIDGLDKLREGARVRKPGDGAKDKEASPDSSQKKGS